jgi:5-methylcytosine-specific restriction endonuclease McrA
MSHASSHLGLFHWPKGVKMFLERTDYCNSVKDAMIVRCPECDFDYSHFKSIQYRYTDNDYIVNREIAITDEGETHERKTKVSKLFKGNEIEICFWGECSHDWKVIFSFHKGNTYVHYEKIQKISPLQVSPQEKYKEYLQSDNWKKLTARKRKSAKNKCQLCNDGEKTLHVHHRTYENLYKEKLADLIVLCEKCHRKFHDKDKT